jgi:hypothetical protein
MTTKSLPEWKKSIGQMAIATAIETDGIKDTSNVEWETDELTIDAVLPVNDLAGGEAGFEVEASTTATESEQITKARKNPPGKAHPVEYRNHDVEVHVQIQFFPSRNDNLGAAEGMVQTEGGAPTPPGCGY